MPTRLRLLAVLVLALLPLVPARAQESNAPARFFIDAMAVEGVRYASARVIVAETRLQTGREYTEIEIRDGAARAARLPFVVRVDPRLEKGARRGAYRLVLAVTETKPLFFGANYLRVSGDPSQRDEHDATAGARLFLGRSGLLHAAATAGGDTPRVELGYTQYDLFGSGIFVSATAAYDAISATPPNHLLQASTREHLTGQVIAGIPLRGNNALRATWTNYPLAIRRIGPPTGPPQNLFEVTHASTTELAWIYDSTDDPLFTTTGTRGLVSAAIRRLPFNERVGRPSILVRHTDTEPWLTADVRHLWAVTPRQSLSVHVGDSAIRRQLPVNRVRETVNESFAGAGYAFTIWGPDRPGRPGDLRFEAGVVRSRLMLHFANHAASGDALHSTSARAGLVFRNAWGVVRLQFDLERGDE